MIDGGGFCAWCYAKGIVELISRLSVYLKILHGFYKGEKGDSDSLVDPEFLTWKLSSPTPFQAEIQINSVILEG